MDNCNKLCRFRGGKYEIMVKTIKNNIISVYFSSLIPAILTFVFWVLVSNLTNSEIVGIIAGIASFSMILGVLSNFDIGIGMKRFLSKAVAENNLKYFKNIVSIASVFLFATSIIIIIIAVNPVFDFFELSGIEKQFIPIVITIVIGNGLQHIFRQTLISKLESQKILFPAIIASIARFPLFFALFAVVDDNILSVTTSYSIFYVIIVSILFYIVIRDLKKIEGPFFNNSQKNLSTIIRGSIPRWIPQVIAVLGTQVGILAVFTIKGASDAGLYYIPFAIYNILFLVSAAVTQISHTIFSRTEDHETQLLFLRKSLKLAFFGTLPLVAMLMFYAEGFLSTFGKEFEISGNTLSIFLISFPFGIIADSAFYLFFGRGKYKKILFLGLAGNIPRIILYYILIPELGIEGGAIAFVVGTLCQFILSIIYLEKEKYRIQYSALFITSIIPISIGFVLEQIGIGIIGSILIIVISFIAFLKLKIVNEEDTLEILKTIMGDEKAITANEKLVSKLKKLHIF